MRSRKEIKADFERTFPQRKDEQLNFQRQKLLLEAIQDLHEFLEKKLETMFVLHPDKLEISVKEKP